MKKLLVLIALLAAVTTQAQNQRTVTWDCSAFHTNIMRYPLYLHSVSFQATATNITGHSFDLYDSPTNSRLIGHTAYSNLTLVVSNVNAAAITNLGVKLADGSYSLLSTNPATGATNVFTWPEGSSTIRTVTNVVAAGVTTARYITKVQMTSNDITTITWDPPGLFVGRGIYITNASGAYPPGGQLVFTITPGQ